MSKIEYRNREFLYQKYVVENKSYDEIAEITNTSKQTIWYWIIKFGIPRKPKRPYRRMINPNLLIQEYVHNKKSIRQLAKIFNKSEKTIRRQLVDFNIPRRHAGYPKGVRSEEKHPRWKGDNAKDEAGRARALRWFKNKKPCEKCGSPEGHRHHKDGNPKNNNHENIQWLCHLCHMKIHREKKKE